jgi:hypothetical protein
MAGNGIEKKMKRLKKTLLDCGHALRTTQSRNPEEPSERSA